MTPNAQANLTSLIEQILRQGGSYPQWYAGIANDPEKRLFEDHKVNRQYGWAWRRLASDSEARDVEDALFSLGCKGGPGGGDATTKTAYVYKITTTTFEST